MTNTRRAPKGGSKIILDICCFFVIDQVCSLHILSIPSIGQPYPLRTPLNTGTTQTNTTFKDGGKYLMSHTSILSKSIVVRLDLNILLES